jgi:hypothetical protein
MTTPFIKTPIQKQIENYVTSGRGYYNKDTRFSTKLINAIVGDSFHKSSEGLKLRLMYNAYTDGQVSREYVRIIEESL